MIYYINFSQNHFLLLSLEKLLKLKNNDKLKKITYKQINILNENDRIIYLLNDELDLIYVSEIIEITSNILIFSNNENLIKKMKLIDDLHIFSINNFYKNFNINFFKKILLTNK